MSSWFHRVKKYVWDEEKTPFHLLPVEMHKKQAHNELFIYAAIEGILTAILIFGILAQIFMGGKIAYVPLLLYSLMLMGALYVLVNRKPIWAALVSSSPPLVMFGLLFWFGFHPNNTSFDKLILGGFLVFWVIYSVRILDICRNYPEMAETVNS